MSGGGEKGLGATKTPADFLKSIRGRPVVVKLNSGVDYREYLWSKGTNAFGLRVEAHSKAASRRVGLRLGYMCVIS
ncbi:hypothetical protein IFM89_001414 [Coptis chinensis]|uniref:Uncharacterized protein n=1 Tax=Coptis chinensis TaxID=261450 RepID=A0A835M158_9MAGN|nr:hypothetical protein IFM89_001414 [Coptis chinensis]